MVASARKRRALKKAYYEKHKEEIRIKSREYYKANAEARKANAESRKAAARAYYQANAESRKAAARAYYQANAEAKKAAARANAKAYYQANTEAKKAAARAYYHANAEARKAAARAKYQANAEKLKIARQNKKRQVEREMGLIDETVTKRGRKGGSSTSTRPSSKLKPRPEHTSSHTLGSSPTDSKTSEKTAFTCNTDPPRLFTINHSSSYLLPKGSGSSSSWPQNVCLDACSCTKLEHGRCVTDVGHGSGTVHGERQREEDCTAVKNNIGDANMKKDIIKKKVFKKSTEGRPVNSFPIPSPAPSLEVCPDCLVDVDSSAVSEFNDWNKAEVERLKEGLRKFGRVWGKISRQNGVNKSAKQCKEYFNTHCAIENLGLPQAVADHSYSVFKNKVRAQGLNSTLSSKDSTQAESPKSTMTRPPRANPLLGKPSLKARKASSPFCPTKKRVGSRGTYANMARSKSNSIIAKLLESGASRRDATRGNVQSLSPMQSHQPQKQLTGVVTFDLRGALTVVVPPTPAKSQQASRDPPLPKTSKVLSPSSSSCSQVSMNVSSALIQVLLSTSNTHSLPSTCTSASSAHRRPSTSTRAHRQPSTSTGAHRQLSTSTGAHHQPSTSTGAYRQCSTSSTHHQPSTAVSSSHRKLTCTTRSSTHHQPSTSSTHRQSASPCFCTLKQVLVSKACSSHLSPRMYDRLQRHSLTPPSTSRVNSSKVTNTRIHPSSLRRSTRTRKSRSTTTNSESSFTLLSQSLSTNSSVSNQLLSVCSHNSLSQTDGAIINLSSTQLLPTASTRPKSDQPAVRRSCLTSMCSLVDKLVSGTSWQSDIDDGASASGRHAIATSSGSAVSC